MEVYAWLIDFAHVRKNCPTGIIPEWMQKVTRYDEMIQWMSVGIDNGSVPTRNCSFNYEMSSRPRKYYVSFERLGAKTRHFPIRHREHETQETFS